MTIFAILPDYRLHYFFTILYSVEDKTADFEPWFLIIFLNFPKIAKDVKGRSKEVDSRPIPFSLFDI